MGKPGAGSSTAPVGFGETEFPFEIPTRRRGSPAVTESSSIPEPAEDLPEQMRVRRSKRDRLLDEGGDAYPVEVSRTHSLAELRTSYGDLPIDTATGERVAVTGRVMYLRNTGKLCFATLREGDGTELQAMLSLDRVGPEALEAWK